MQQRKHNWQDEVLEVEEGLILHSVNESFVTPVFELVQRNKAWLQQAMDWPQYVKAPEDTLKTLRGNHMLHHRNYAKMFMILLEDELAGVISFNQIEPANKAAYIGYWLDRGHQGQGIISRALQAMMAKYSAEGLIRRFVIRCIVSNEASNAVALRNGFTLEGCMKQAEYLNGRFHDQNVYGRIIDCVQPD